MRSLMEVEKSGMNVKPAKYHVGGGKWQGGVQGEENERGARLGPSGPVINNSGGVIDSLIT